MGTDAAEESKLVCVKTGSDQATEVETLPLKAVSRGV